MIQEAQKNVYLVLSTILGNALEELKEFCDENDMDFEEEALRHVNQIKEG